MSSSGAVPAFMPLMPLAPGVRDGWRSPHPGL